MSAETEPVKRSLNAVYIVIDTSFILKGLLIDKLLDSEALLERCKYIRKVSGKSLRLPEGVKLEMRNCLLRHRHEENVQKSLKLFRRMRHFSAIPNIEELHYFDFFKTQIKKIGKKLNAYKETMDLSSIDARIGAYAILKTKKGEVILGTRDDLLMRTVQKVYDITHKVFAERGISNRKLYLARTPADIEAALDDIGRVKSERRLEFELRHQEKELGFTKYSHS